MERNYDEVIAELTIQIVSLKDDLEKVKNRDNLTVKRVTKLENRVEFLNKQLDSFKVAFDEYIAFQSRLNSNFSDFMNRNSK